MTLDINKVTAVYIKIRDARSALKQEYEAADANLKAQAERLEAEMLRKLQADNVDSMGTQSGTVYKQEDLRPAGSDWGALYKWIAENDAFEFLERRIKVTAIKEYMELHEGALPPGVSVHREFKVRVRRA